MKYEAKPLIPIEKQNKVSNSEFWGLLEQIEFSMKQALTSKKRWQRALWYDHADNLLLRWFYIRERTIYRFVSLAFFINRTAAILKFL